MNINKNVIIVTTFVQSLVDTILEFIEYVVIAPDFSAKDVFDSKELPKSLLEMLKPRAILAIEILQSILKKHGNKEENESFSKHAEFIKEKIGEIDPTVSLEDSEAFKEIKKRFSEISKLRIFMKKMKKIRNTEMEKPIIQKVKEYLDVPGSKEKPVVTKTADDNLVDIVKDIHHKQFLLVKIGEKKDITKFFTEEDLEKVKHFVSTMEMVLDNSMYEEVNEDVDKELIEALRKTNGVFDIEDAEIVEESGEEKQEDEPACAKLAKEG